MFIQERGLGASRRPETTSPLGATSRGGSLTAQSERSPLLSERTTGREVLSGAEGLRSGRPTTSPPGRTETPTKSVERSPLLSEPTIGRDVISRREESLSGRSGSVTPGRAESVAKPTDRSPLLSGRTTGREIIAGRESSGWVRSTPSAGSRLGSTSDRAAGADRGRSLGTTGGIERDGRSGGIGGEEPTGSRSAERLRIIPRPGRAPDSPSSDPTGLPAVRERELLPGPSASGRTVDPAESRRGVERGGPGAAAFESIVPERSVSQEINEAAQTLRGRSSTARSLYAERSDLALGAAAATRERLTQAQLTLLSTPGSAAAGGSTSGAAPIVEGARRTMEVKRGAWGRAVTVDVDAAFRHVHGPGCGHFFHSGHWHDFPAYHVHFPGCGHYFYAGGWHSFAAFHVHGPGCGHFLDGGLWLSFGHHHHYPGCGHFFWGGLWHGYSLYHTHYAGCGHFFYDGYWHDFPAYHVHSATCGHFYDGLRWHAHGYGPHVHGPDCGHFFHHGAWYAYPSSYYVRRPSESFYFFVDLGAYGDRRVPDYVSTYQRQYDRQRGDVFEGRDHAASAYAHFAEKRYFRAIVEFDAAIEQRRDDGLLYFARAQAFFAVGDYRSAYEDLIAGMQWIPDWLDTQLNLTELYGDPAEFTAQLQALQKWTREEPKDFRAHFLLAYVYYFLQEYDLARAEVVYTLAYAPDHAEARRLLDKIYERQAEQEFGDDAPASVAARQPERL